MIVVGDPKTLRKAAAFVEKFAALVEEFSAAVPAQADDGTVFEFALNSTDFVVTTHPGRSGEFALGLRTLA